MENISNELINDEEFDLICKYIKIRYESNMSQRELASKIGIAQSTIARMEKNMHSMSIGNFIKLLSVLWYKLEIIEREKENELHEKIVQLIMIVKDSKMKKIDTLDIERIFRLNGGIRMSQNKLETISNLFEGKEIRSVWDSEKEEYYFSVVDVIGVLTDNDYQKSRNYWKWLKSKLNEEGSKLVSKTNQLKMKSSKDGKMYKTDTLDTEGIFRLIESVPSPKAESFCIK